MEQFEMPMGVVYRVEMWLVYSGDGLMAVVLKDKG